MSSNFAVPSVVVGVGTLNYLFEPAWHVDNVLKMFMYGIKAGMDLGKIKLHLQSRLSDTFPWEILAEYKGQRLVSIYHQVNMEHYYLVKNHLGG
jgi:hypothetical protein